MDGRGAFCEEEITRLLRRRELTIRVCESIGSTNTALKALAAEGAPAGLALIAEEQTAGRGRLGRSFFSPAGSGLYLSLLLRPELPAGAAVRLTAGAAVAAAEAIEALSGRRCGIKWVNDILVDDRKVCGILAEAAADSAGRTQYVVLGLGFNIYPPESGFPAELSGSAGAIFPERPSDDPRARLAAGVLDRLWEIAADPADPGIFERYKRRCILLGRRIRVLAPGRPPESALAVDLNDDYSLQVRLDDGSERSLCSGEVSVRPVGDPDIRGRSGRVGRSL